MKLLNRLKSTLAVLAIIMTFGMPLIAIAQEETAEPTAEVTVAPTAVVDVPVVGDIELVDFVPEDTLEGSVINTILEAIAVAVYFPAVSGFVVFGTAVMKRFVPYPSQNIALTIMIILWGIYILATGLGYETQLLEVLDAITEIGYYLLGGTGSAIAAAKIYEGSARHKIPVVGYSRHVAEYQRTAEQAQG